MSAIKREPLTEAEIEQMEQAVSDVGLGFNTQDLPRRYARDVRRLLDEREALLMELVKKQMDAVKDVGDVIIVGGPTA